MTGTSRRGFLGRLLGGAVVTAVVPVSKVEAVYVPAAVKLPKKLPPGRVIPTSKPTLPPWVGGFVHSRYRNHRIQIEPTRAIQFRDGIAQVSEHDAARLLMTKAYRDHEIWLEGDKPYVKPAETSQAPTRARRRKTR